MIFGKIADKLNKKASSVEEEIKFKDYTAESEERFTPPAAPAVSEPAPAPSLSATATEKEGNIELKIAHPDSFEDVADIADFLLSGCTVLLNVEAVEKNQVLRMLDFLNGVTYTTGGDIRLVSQNTYIITPHDVDVSGDD